MRRVFSLMLCFGLVGTVMGQSPGEKDKPEAESPPPRDEAKHQQAVEVLKKVDIATKAVQMLRYDAQRAGHGWLESRAFKASGKVLQAGKSDQGFSKYLITAKIHPTESTEAIDTTTGSDGETYYLIDSAKKMVYADIDPSVVGSDGRMAMSIAMLEFSHPTPFKDEIESMSAEIKGTTTIGDQECDEIHVLYRPDLEATWFFSKKDHLPRRVDRIAKSPTGEKGAVSLTLTNLEVNPKVGDSAFKLVVPEGFEKTDEFAPIRRPPR